MTKLPPNYNLLDKVGYPGLLGQAEWQKLHPMVRKRFSSDSNKKATYQGVMKEVYLSFAGKVFAQLCRLIGTPLALYSGHNVPMEVHVYDDKDLGGMIWDRYYLYRDNPVNRVKSSKVILPEGILVEMVGYGLGMKLDVSQKDGAIFFESDYFFLQIGDRRIKIPNILTPGKTVVSQSAISDQAFEFSLKVTHSVFGVTYRQVGVFSEKEENNAE